MKPNSHNIRTCIFSQLRNLFGTYFLTTQTWRKIASTPTSPRPHGLLASLSSLDVLPLRL